MKCPKCNGSGWDDEHMIKCLHCHGSGEVVQTNEEWFCSLSTKEKAKWIAEEKLCRGYFIFPSMEEAIQDAMEWLKEVHQ